MSTPAASSVSSNVNTPPSMLKTLATSLNQAAKFTAQKAKETCDYLRAPPTQVTCKGCQNPVIVPPQIFNWSCPACTLINEHRQAQCSACGQARPPIHLLTVGCTVCHAQVPVPTSNAKKGLIEAKETTKKLAVQAHQAAKEKYEYLKAEPEHFNCEHCNTKLYNPNFVKSSSEDGIGEPDDTAHVNQNQDEQESKILPSSAPAPPQVAHIGCPICKKITAVPRSNFKNSLVSGATSASRSATRAYCTLAGKCCVDCPVCQNPVKYVPPPLPSPSPPSPSLAPTSSPSAPAPQSGPTSQMATVASAPPAHGQDQSRSRAVPLITKVDLQCKKCGTTFPTTASISVQ